MARNSEQYGWVASRTIDGTTTTLGFETHGHPCVLIEVLSSSSLSMKAGLMGKVGTNRTVASTLLSGASTETDIAPDTATGTVAAQDFILVPTLGAKRVVMIRAAGSGAIQGVAMPFDAFASWYLQRIMRKLTAGLIAAESSSTPYHLIADGTDELLISASARRLTAAQIFSLNDAPVYAKFYDKATAPSEADTPIWVVGSPANSTAANGAGNSPSFPTGGIALTNGLGVRVVKGLADNSDTAADAAENIVNAAYKTS